MNRENSISVVIPVFNRRDLLIRALDSAISQTMPNREIIVIDDQSNYSVKEFLRDKYGDSIVTITNSAQIGAAASRNIGVQNAGGEFIAFLDSDDYWHPEKNDKQLALFRDNSALGLVYCKPWVVKNTGEIKRLDVRMVNRNLGDYLIEGWLAPNTSTLMIRRSTFIDLGGFDEALTSCQDHDLWMRMAFSNIPVAYTNDNLSYFSMESKNRISLNRKIRINGMIKFLEKWKNPLVDKYGRQKFFRFRNFYYQKVTFSLMVHSIKRGELIPATAIYLNYLIFNLAFYKGVLTRISNKLRY